MERRAFLKRASEANDEEIEAIIPKLTEHLVLAIREVAPLARLDADAILDSDDE
jgi:hypothetical protein